MIWTIWKRWVDSHRWWWLLLLPAIMLLDVVVGTWVIAREIELLRRMWE